MSSPSPSRDPFHYEVVKVLKEFEEVLDDMWKDTFLNGRVNVGHVVEMLQMLPRLKRIIRGAEKRFWDHLTEGNV